MRCSLNLLEKYFSFEGSRPKARAVVLAIAYKVSKGAKIRSRYNQVQLLTQDTNGKVTNSQLDRKT